MAVAGVGDRDRNVAADRLRSAGAPIDVTVERTAMEKVEPKNVSISVMSAVSRETASPVLSFEK